MAQCHFLIGLMSITLRAMKINLISLCCLVLVSCTWIGQKKDDKTKWKEVSVRLLNIADTMKVEDVHSLAYLALANANINGWEADVTADWYRKTLEYLDNHPYGLGYEWDAFQDGTINAASTNYTITMSDHVGPVLLKGYKRGVVSAAELSALVQALEKVPLADSLSPGICYAYSDDPNDRIGCVHNVNASVAVFYHMLDEIKFSDSSYSELVNEITTRENSAYMETKVNYPYWDGSVNLTDQNHLAFQAWCLMQLPNERANEIGMQIIDHLTLNREKSLSSLIGHLRILPYNDRNANEIFSEIDDLLNQPEDSGEDGGTYVLSSPRIIAQLAVHCSAYYKHKSDI